MRPETRRQIRETVLYNMAPANSGQLSLEDLGRVFQGRGELGEVENCLEELVREGLAKKVMLAGRSYYLFESIARKAAEENERKLQAIEKEEETLRRESEELSRLISEEELALSRLRPAWMFGWNRSGLDSEKISRIQTYVAAFTDTVLETHRRELRTVKKRLADLASDRERKLRWKEATFLPTTPS